jgi:hypothetical protein
VETLFAQTPAAPPFDPTIIQNSISWPVATMAQLIFFVGLVCYVLVIVKMFDREWTTLAIVCIVGVFCGGNLVAFIVGWVKVSEWKLLKVMLVWTVSFVIQLGLSVYLFSTILAAIMANMPPNQPANP